MIETLNLVYQIGFMVMAVLLALSYKAVINNLRLLWLRKRAVKVEFINADGTRTSIIAKREGPEFVYKDMRFFLNPRKALLENNIRVFTYVNHNAIAHDYFNKPEEILRKLLKEAREIQVKVKKKTGKNEFKEELRAVKDISENFHDMYSEPYRIDARLIQEAMTKAQLSSATVFDKIIQLFTSKNFLTIAVVAVVASGAAAVFGWLIYDKVSQGVICTNIENIVKTIRP